MKNGAARTAGWRLIKAAPRNRATTTGELRRRLVRKVDAAVACGHEVRVLSTANPAHPEIERAVVHRLGQRDVEVEPVDRLVRLPVEVGHAERYRRGKIVSEEGEGEDGERD